MISPQAIEEAALALLCFSDEHAPLLSLKLINNKLFSNRTNQTLSKVAIEYVQKYSKAPGMQLEYLLEIDIRRGDEGKLLWQSIEFLSKQVNQIQASFVLEQLDKYLEIQTLSYSLQNALESLNEGDLDKAREVLYQQEVPIQNDAGVWISDTKNSMAFFDKDEFTDYFSTGIEVFDKRRVRPDRGTLTLMIASTGKGKTWWLVEVGKQGLMHHHRVLHITLELNEQKTIRRYIQSIFSLTQNETELIKTPYFDLDVAGNMRMQFREFEREALLAKKQHIRNTLSKMQRWQLLVKQFPTGDLSYEGLVLYLEGLRKERKWEPDLVIIDYADLLKVNVADYRIDLGLLYKKLRGLSISRNFALVSATQGNRQAEKSKLVDRDNVAEDWSKIGTADNVFTYSQTPQEHYLGLARMFASKGRDAGDRFLALISQAYSIGQFCIDSTPMNTDLVNQIQGAAPQE